MATATSPDPGTVPNATESPKPGLFQRIWARIPSTDAFERRKNSIVAEDSKDLLGKLRRIIPVVPGETRRIHFTDDGLMSLFIKDAATLRFWHEEFINWLVSLGIVGTVGTIMACTITAKRIWHIHQPWVVWLWAILSICSVLVACMVCVVITTTFLGEFVKASLPMPARRVGLLAPCALALFGYLIVVHRLRVISPQSTLTFAASVGVFGVSLFVASVSMWAFCMLLMHRMVQRQTWEAHPEAFIFQGLLDLLPLSNYDFQYSFGTAELLNGLEHVAYLIEVPLTQRLQAGDSIIQNWLEEGMKRRAAAIRELKKTAIHSGGLIPVELTQKLEVTLVHVCNLDWKLLEELQVPVVSKRERARLFGQRLLTAATVSIIPAGILVARLSVGSVQQFDKTNVVLIGSIAWLCVNLLSAFDPDYSLTKQGLDLLNKLPGVGGRGQDTSSGSKH
jgi:hypothetical protein